MFFYYYYASKECDNVYMCQIQNPMDQTYNISKQNKLSKEGDNIYMCQI